MIYNRDTNEFLLIVMNNELLYYYLIKSENPSTAWDLYQSAADSEFQHIDPNNLNFAAINDFLNKKRFELKSEVQ